MFDVVASTSLYYHAWDGNVRAYWLNEALFPRQLPSDELQGRYEPGNEVGNEAGNKAGYEPGNEAGYEPGNEAGMN